MEGAPGKSILKNLAFAGKWFATCPFGKGA
jgi:hypothetical protein